jgi:hypothetical protein
MIRGRGGELGGFMRLHMQVRLYFYIFFITITYRHLLHFPNFSTHIYFSNDPSLTIFLFCPKKIWKSLKSKVTLCTNVLDMTMCHALELVLKLKCQGHTCMLKLMTWIFCIYVVLRVEYRTIAHPDKSPHIQKWQGGLKL